MAKNPDWVGRITGIALAVRGPLAEPVRVDGVAVKPGGAVGQLADRLREWLAFEPWYGTSINTITGGADVQELPLPTLLVVALAIAAAIWLALAWRARRAAAFPAGRSRCCSSPHGSCSTRSGRGTSRGRSARRARSTAARTGASAISPPRTGHSSRSSRRRARSCPPRPRACSSWPTPRTSAVAAPTTCTRTTCSSIRSTTPLPQGLVAAARRLRRSSTSVAACNTTPRRRSCASKAAIRCPPKSLLVEPGAALFKVL